MKNLAIIGASYLQLPLINKAKEMGYTTHVFAWKANDVGEREADYFYPISIIEKERILEKCREIGICGICSISSDLASVTVNYVADHLGLIGNSLECTEVSTNKSQMRKCFAIHHDPSPRSFTVTGLEEINTDLLDFPVIVKPLDRSGSRGISKVESVEQLKEAIELAISQGFEKKAIVEDYLEGEEFSVESISWEGEHHLLAVTKKYTTGSPNYIETGHMEPADISDEMKERIKETVFHALNSLGVRYGASHSEIMINGDYIGIVEIGARMGGDLIGSDLVELSTGFDFVKAVIEIAVGIRPEFRYADNGNCAGVKFIFNQEDLKAFEKIREEDEDIILRYEIDEGHIGDTVTDSSNRHGYYLLCSKDKDKIIRFMNM